MNLGKETETLEFKKSTSEIKTAMISIASILNKHGIGTLYFGVKPNGDVVGQNVSESSLRDVSRAVYESIKPQIYPAIDEILINGKQLIKVEFSSDSKPYSAAGRYYLRTADEDREVSPEELKTFFEANKYRTKWENGKSDTLSKQVDKLAVKSFWQKAISAGRLPEGRYTTPIILKKFGLVKDEYLTNAGEVLFGNTRPVSLKVGIFASDEKLTILDMKLYEDNIYNLLKTAEDYIFKNIRWKVEIIESERNEIPEIPTAVIREVLANSFAHAMYGSRTNHEICIYPGMITIYSPGDYASRYKPEEYIKGNVESEIRNATISKILYLSKYIEQFGSGFKRIDSLCKDSGIKYSYENKDNGFKFILYRPQVQSDILDVTLDVTLNGTEKAVYAILKQKPASSREEIADKISKTVRTVQRALNSLVEKGYIRRVGSKQNPVWEILK
ncbi:MAG TPA: winged helix-turn-helix transcriptional regulator [Christensenellaceae bacterium]|nr:winged helix-turn-helix transcriptional regulator [Christensenellaceae bacterium]